MRTLMLTGIALVLLTGCASRQCRAPAQFTQPPPFVPPFDGAASAEDLPGASPTRIPDAYPPVPAYDVMASSTADLSAEFTYRPVTVDQVACQAAAYAPLANLLESERDALGVAEQCESGRACRSALEHDLLHLRAREEREAAAFQALELFYGIVEAEAAWGANEQAIEVLTHHLAEMRKLREQGVGGTLEEDALRRQLVDQRLKGEEARRMILELNSQLATLLGLSSSPSCRFDPQVSWEVEANVADLQTALAEGLANRADLRLLRRLNNEINADTVVVARGVLSTAAPGTGVAPMVTNLLAAWTHCACLACEEPIRRRQVEQLLIARERMAASEIQRAWVALASESRKASLQQERRQLLEDRAKQLRLLRGTGGATPAQVLEADLERIAGRHEWQRQIVAVRRAELQLLRAKGDVLAACSFRE